MNSKTQTQRRHRTGRAFGVTAINRVADRIDLAIDLLTLGQYGLECREVADADERLRGEQGSDPSWIPHRLGGPSYVAPARLRVAMAAASRPQWGPRTLARLNTAR